MRELTDGSANDQVANWSPDGKKLVFHSDSSGKNQLYTWEEGEMSRLSDTPHVDKSASWSPDGRRIAFLSVRGTGPSGVYVMNADGSATRRIGELDLVHGLPFFSPDGGRLLVTPSTPKGTRIWTMDVESGETTALTSCGS